MRDVFLVICTACSLVGCSLPESSIPAARRIASPEPLTAATVFEGTIYVGSQRGLWRVTADALEFLDVFVEPPDPMAKGKGKGHHDHHHDDGPQVKKLLVLDGGLWSINDWFLWRRRNGGWSKAGKGRYASLCVHDKDVIGASSRELYRFRRNRIDRLNRSRSEEPILDLLPLAGKLYLLHARAISVTDAASRYALERWPLGVPEGAQAHSFLALGAAIIVAASDGTYHLRPAAGGVSEALRIDDRPATCLSVDPHGQLWIGREDGAARLRVDADGRVEERVVFPVGAVRAFACTSRWTYAATGDGLYELPAGATGN